jgi:hypothetical protein
MAKLTKKSVRCTCGEATYNLITTGDPLQACQAFKGKKCALGESVSVELLESERSSSLLQPAISDSVTVYDATREVEKRGVNGSYCVCRCRTTSGTGPTFKVYGCRQAGQTGPVCSQCCENACNNASATGIVGPEYELTDLSDDVKNATFLEPTVLESGTNYIIRSFNERSIQILSNSFSKTVELLGERISKSNEEVFKAVASAINNMPSFLKATINDDNIDVIKPEKKEGDGDKDFGGGCKDCGGSGGVLKQCVNGLGTTICIQVDPNIDINWGWPPSGGVKGGTITITINF